MNKETKVATQTKDKLMTSTISSLMSGVVDTQTIIDMDRRHYVHPYHLFDSINEDGALPIEKAEGAYIWDSNGKRYLDSVGGM